MILFIRLTGAVVVVARIEIFVPEKFPGAAMEIIRAGLDHGVDDGAIAAAELRTIRVGLYLEFLERIDGRLNHEVRFVQ